MTENQETAICVTCGEQRPTDRFEVGDCTCLDCYDAGRPGVNYPDETAATECDTCGDRLGEHGVVRINGEVSYICPSGFEVDT